MQFYLYVLLRWCISTRKERNTAPNSRQASVHDSDLYTCNAWFESQPWHILLWQDICGFPQPLQAKDWVMPWNKSHDLFLPNHFKFTDVTIQKIHLLVWWTEHNQRYSPHDADFFIWYWGGCQYQNPSLKVDVSITNESMIIYEASEAFQTHKVWLVWIYIKVLAIYWYSRTSFSHLAKNTI
jgi:hypothetical protein